MRGQTWFFDDIPLGYTHACGSADVTADDVAVFKERFAPHLPLDLQDPQPDADATDAAAQAHVYALWSRLLYAETKDWPILARLGQDALRWYKPAKAGDTVTLRITFLSKQPVNDQRGILIANHELVNQEGALVMALMTRTVIARQAGR